MQVRVKVKSTGDLKIMSESSAKRLIQVNSAEYSIVAPPKVEVMNLPPLQPVNTEKKSVVVADAEPPFGDEDNPLANPTTEPEKRKPGRPFKTDP